MEDLVEKYATPSEKEMLENDLVTEDQKQAIRDTIIAKGEWAEANNELSDEEKVIQSCEAKLFLLEEMINNKTFSKNDLERLFKASLYLGVNKDEPKFQNSTENHAFDLIKQIYKDKIYLAVVAMGGKFEKGEDSNE